MKGRIYSYSLVILFHLALVAEATKYVQNFEQLQDEFGSEDLIFMTKKPIHNNRSYGGPTTSVPHVGITTHEPKVTELVYEDEWLLPGFAAQEDLLLNRDKRAVEASGDGAPELSACLGVDNAEGLVASTSANYNTFKTATETAIYEKCKVTATTLSSVEVLDVDVDKSVINFKFVFPSSSDTSNSAQCLRDIQTQGSLTVDNVEFQITKDPLIENGANQLVAAVCLLCPAQQECLLNVANLHFCGTTDLFSTSQSGKLPNTDDAVSSVTIPSQIPIGSSLHNEFYISSNGFLSVVNNPGPKSASLTSVDFDILAVAWTDLDTNVNGEVLYEAHAMSSSISAESQAVLTRASSDVQNFAPKSSFEATTAIVVTWKNISKLHGSNTQHATFQLVLASDGLETYALYFYGYNSWAETNDVVIGFRNNEGSETNFFSQKSLITDLKSIKGNTASNGIWIYKVGEVTINYIERCSRFHSTEAHNKNTYRKKNLEVPNCPCSKEFLNEKFVVEINDTNTNRECYVINTLGLYDTYSRLCCYMRSTNQFIRSDPFSGSLLRYNPLTNRQQYIQEDFNPWSDCCIQSSKCNLFRQVRPNRECFAVSNAALVFGYGDPHISTADGFAYTFNGLGEFTFLQIGSFTIQVRTVKVTDAQGNKLPATVFGAFAVSDGNEGRFQVELSSFFDRLVLFVNGRDVSIEFYEKTDYLYVISNVLSLRRSGTNSADLITSNGITLKVQLALRMLNVGFSIPKTFLKANGAAAQVRGLVGNYDGDKTNDITKRNGEILPIPATDKLIFEAAKTWIVTEAESLFIYQNGLTYKDYNDPSFTPIFGSDFTPQQLSAGAQVCGGDDKPFCIYDYTITQDSTIAMYTEDLNLNSQQDLSVRENSIPKISVDKPHIDATVNQEITLTLNTSDADSDAVSVSVINQPASGFKFNPVAGTATWTPSNNNIASIGFLATDSKNAQSPLLNIDITLCPTCNGNGTCITGETRNFPETNYFRILKCDCENGIEGDDCEKESDGCHFKPCDPLQTCTDKPGKLAKDALGYTCSACPTGYSNTSPQKCQDINECTDTTICGTGGTCQNVPGSYTCTCSAGYRLVGQKCQDINECLDRTHNCEQICNNTDGSFECSTQTSDCTTKPCEYGCKTNGTDENCFCPSTKKVVDDTKCIDFDECSINICQHICVNKDPGFTCSCQDGFKLAADNVSCEACTGLSWGPECSQTCDCNGRGSCDPVIGCQCNSMWTGQDCSTDIDECTVNPNICPVGFLCKNLAGSYECNCPDGYDKVNDECKDVDECTKTPGICSGSNEICVNNVGSYTCVCDKGFLRNQTNQQCEDIDECTSGTHGCEQICINQIGSVNCQCQLGFRIRNDRKTCETDPSRDPCANFAPTCQYGCKLENDQPVCFCQTGFVLGTDGKSCVDVNECVGNHGCSDKCVNTIGSFECSCTQYRKLQNDGKTCRACSSNEWGTDCEKTCDCSTVGTQECVKETGCKCKTGWTGDKCDQDENECSIPGVCTITGSVCVNTHGSYQCNCKDGYQLSTDKTKCEDIKECSLTPKVCEQNCNETDGSYYCFCDNGFVLNTATNKCDDIDECANGKSNCDQNCRNTFGSFVCECNTGYIIDSDRKTCNAENVCNVTNTCQQNCAKIANVDTCGCKDGYTLDANNKTCTAVDPCAPNPCKNGTCSSPSRPAFICSCSIGQQLINDGVTCEVCPEGKYGSDCDSTCTCVSSNTKSCNKETGECTCNSGWKGTNCEVNIDECSVSTDNNCAINTTCEDTDGSFICQCKSGSVSVNGICQACPEGKYGMNCANTCTCVSSNTMSCNKETGGCSCKAGWLGAKCDSNFNECAVTTICDSVPNSKCEDTQGSFNCKCNTGFVKVSGKCEDENECLTTKNTCKASNHQVCINTVGSFKCDCKEGYFPNGQICIDIDECVVNKNGCEYNCTNTPGSSYCSCPIGQKLNERDSRSCYVEADETKENYQIRLDINKDNIVNNPASYEHVKLKKDISDAVLKYIQTEDNSGVIDVNVTSLRVGSVIAEMEVIANQFQSLNASVLSKRFYDLLQGQELEIDGTKTKVLGITKDGTTLTSGSSKCEILKEIKQCDTKTELCEVQDDKPVCRKVSETSEQDLALIIGLSVGIPLGFLLLAGLTCCIYFCVKHQRNNSQGSDRVVNSEPRDPFRSVFSGPVPKRGGWAANRYGLYSPDTLSAASHTSSDSDGKLIKSRRKPDRMDFNDSAWNDNRSFSYPSDPQDGTTGNFSWEHMFRALEPMRNFEIQRPNVQASPVYPVRGRRPDSMA